MFFAWQKMFHGGWTPVKSLEDPRSFASAKAGQRKYKTVLVIPKEAEHFTPTQVSQIMPGGDFFAVWREAIKEVNPKADLPKSSPSKRLPPP